MRYYVYSDVNGKSMEFTQSAWMKLVTLAMRHWNPRGPVPVLEGSGFATQEEMNTWAPKHTLGCYCDDNPNAVWRVLKEDAAGMARGLEQIKDNEIRDIVPPILEGTISPKEYLQELIKLCVRGSFTFRFQPGAKLAQT